MIFRKLMLLCLVFGMIVGCASMKLSKPILPMKDYEQMIAGRIDADYVGTTRCLSACHFHDQIKRDFDASTMGVQLSQKSGMPIVDCESCHGPGSRAIEDITPEKVEADTRAGKKTECNYKTLIDIKNLPAQAKSLICLKCHTANATFNLHNWNAGIHAISDVSCSDCHSVHVGPDLTVAPRDTEKMCYRCHRKVQAEFSLPSHHPVPEKRVFCTGCHEPHGTANDKLMRKLTVKQTCTRCHGEKEGPFTFAHSDVMEDCGNCHTPHGSMNTDLLKVQVPFLCLRCHMGHRTASTSTAESKATFYTRCTDCHSQIHGTDLPSVSGTGKFTR